MLNTYRDIAAELRRRIRSGVYKVDEPIPPRMDLLKEFGVARSTLDRAMAELQTTGDVTSRRGSGTYANAPSGYRIGFIDSLFEAHLRAVTPPLIRVPEHILEQRSEHSRLLDFDALLWMQPDRERLEIAARFQGRIPQLILNRVETGFPAISFDHRGAYRQITAARLAEYPDCVPILLQQQRDTLPIHYRQAGFADACRERGCFYEICRMPDDFEGKVRVLRQKLEELGDGRPLALVSDSAAHTGAVMVVAREQKWAWKKSHCYSDVDDNYPSCVWGIKVTSLLQDTFLLIQEGTERIRRILEGQDDGKLTLIPMTLREGDT